MALRARQQLVAIRERPPQAIAIRPHDLASDRAAVTTGVDPRGRVLALEEDLRRKSRRTNRSEQPIEQVGLARPVGAHEQRQRGQREGDVEQRAVSFEAHALDADLLWGGRHGGALDEQLSDDLL